MNELLKNMEWNQKIKILRIAKGWNQTKVAEKCFTGQKVYWSWEKRQTYPRRLSRKTIATVFGVKEREIFSDGDRKIN